MATRSRYGNWPGDQEDNPYDNDRLPTPPPPKPPPKPTDKQNSGDTLPPITQALSLEEQRTYDDWLRRNVGDEDRALESIGIDPRRPRYVATEADRDWGREGGPAAFGSEEMGEGEDFVPIPGNLQDQMIVQYAPSWKQALQEKFKQEGRAYDPTVLGGLIRNVSYAQNEGKDPNQFLQEAFRRIEQGARSGGDRSRGGYDTGWADDDPARYATAATDTTPSVASGDPPSGYMKRLGELQSSLAALPTSDTIGRATIQAEIQNMYSGGYQPPPPTISDIVQTPATPNRQGQRSAPSLGVATQTFSPAKRPYSARATDRILSRLPTPSRPVMQTPTEVPFMGTMDGVVNAPTAGVSTAPNWDSVNNDYWRASQDYAAGPNGAGFTPNPWSGTRQRLARNLPSDPTATPDAGAVTDTIAPDSADTRRAYALGRQDRQGATTGNQDYNASQMDRFLRSWNQWNQQGVDPFNTTRRTGGF
jgi:hypothetical protein